MPAGLGFSATQKYGVDITPPLAAVTVNNITPDNLINSAEAGISSTAVTSRTTDVATDTTGVDLSPFTTP